MKTKTDYTKSFIFQDHFVQDILAGRKTETRRICKNLPRVGRRSRFVTQRGGKPFATARIKSLSIQKLGEMNLFDVHREGWPPGSRESRWDWFKRIWTTMHGPWDPDQEVYVITWDKLKKEKP